MCSLHPAVACWTIVALAAAALSPCPPSLDAGALPLARSAGRPAHSHSAPAQGVHDGHAGHGEHAGHAEDAGHGEHAGHAEHARHAGPAAVAGKAAPAGPDGAPAAHGSADATDPETAALRAPCPCGCEKAGGGAPSPGRLPAFVPARFPSTLPDAPPTRPESPAPRAPAPPVLPADPIPI